MTTGVALAASAVVVANPIIAPRADVQIPSVKLSAGSADAADMLDKAFLDAIAPAPPESSNPFSVLGELISSLAADATYLGRNAIVQAFVAGVTAVTQPELTASSTPYLDPSAGALGTPEIAMSVIPGIDLQSVLPDPSAIGSLQTTAAQVAGALSPAAESFVTSIISDAGYVGGELVAAAFAVGAVVAAEPRLIGDTLEALFNGDFRGALQNAVKVVTAPLGPPAMVFDAMRSVLERHLSGVPAVVTSTEGSVASLASVAYIIDQSPTVTSPVGQSPRDPGPVVHVSPGSTPGDESRVPGAASVVGVAPSSVSPSSVSPSDVSPSDVLVDTPAAESAALTAEPAVESVAPPVRPVREAIKAVGAQIDSIVGAGSGARAPAAEAAAQAPATVPAAPRGRGGKAAADGAGR